MTSPPAAPTLQGLFEQNRPVWLRMINQVEAFNQADGTPLPLGGQRVVVVARKGG